MIAQRIRSYTLASRSMPSRKPKLAKEYALAQADKDGRKENNEGTTMCIVHAGFRGFRAFEARKISRCNLTGIRFEIPHDTIH